jgi:hypothetical protein
MHPESPALVVTGSSQSWVPLHSLHAGSSEYLVSFLAITSSTFIIVVGTSESVSIFKTLTSSKIVLIVVYLQVVT